MKVELGRKKNKIKKFWSENKFTIGLVAVVGITTAIVFKSMENKTNYEETEEDVLLHKLEDAFNIEPGRDCLMTFTVEETGEELGVVPVDEAFVKCYIED